MKWKVCLLVVVMLLPGIAFPQAPSLVNFQGKLTDATGVPVADGSYSLRFRVYSAATGDAGNPCTGSCLWEETQNVSPQAGIYSVLLGSVTPLTASVFAGSERYVGVKVDAEAEMTPRRRIASVPYALTAEAPTPSAIPTGTIMLWAGSAAPVGWILCDGAAYDAATDPSLLPLFDAVGNVYGGSDSSDFQVPDLRGRLPLGQDNMGGISADRVIDPQADVMGGNAGEASHELTVAEIPSHTHSKAHKFAPGGFHALGGGSGPFSADQTDESGSAGGNQPHNNMPPYLTLRYIIKQ